MNWIGRLDIVALALLLAYTIAIFVRVFCFCNLPRHWRINATPRNHRECVLDLNILAGNLKSIASTAPYLGLAGTCVGLMTAFRGVGMEKHAAIAMMVSDIAVALVTTAVGIFVAVPATCAYNYICVRLELVRSELPNEAVEWRTRRSQSSRKLPLTRQFSALPAFGMTAAPVLTAVVAVFALFYSSVSEPKGLAVGLAPTCSEYDGDDRFIVLHITDAGKVFLNLEQEDWNNLAHRLTEIYGMRVHRNLYLLADDGIPFQTVADAIDLVKNVPLAANPDSQDITVKLITPKAINAPCPEPVVAASSLHASR